jgi:hypothetical protein
MNRRLVSPSQRERWPTRSCQRDEWTLYGVLGRTAQTYHGIAFLPRGRWRRSLHMSRRSHVLPGRPGELAAGQREAGRTGQNGNGLAGHEMYKSCLIPHAMVRSSGKPGAGKACTPGLGRGGGKRAVWYLVRRLLHLDAGKDASPTYAYFSAFSHREAV